MKRVVGALVAVFAFTTVAVAGEAAKREQPAKPAKAVKLSKSEMAKITAGEQPPPGQRGASTTGQGSNNNNGNNPPNTAP
jgi:hypothetical protein